MDYNTEIINEESLDEMLSLVTTYNADLIGPRLITAGNKVFSAAPYLNENQQPISDGLYEGDDSGYENNCEVTWLPSSFLIVKREVIKAINGFDETYDGSRIEDVDFCLKARAKNFKCFYTGKINVLQHDSQRMDYHEENFKRFIKRWGMHKELFRQIK